MHGDGSQWEEEDERGSETWERRVGDTMAMRTVTGTDTLTRYTA